MSFSRYPAYKDSGVECLGEVPAHWGILPLKVLVAMRSGEAITSEQIDDEGEFPVFGGNGLRGYAASFTHEGSYALIGRQGALCGNVNYASGRFWASEHAVVCAPRRPIAIRWFGEMLRAMNLGQYSIAAAQPGLSVDLVGRIRAPVPPPDEQFAIAGFLDAETTRIDPLIAEQERMIELLKEKRQAVISHAVTKGLDPNAVMKDSGIDWIGPVPAHWRCARNKAVFHEVDERSETDSGELLTVSHITGVTRRSEKDVNMILAETLEGYKMCRQGDLVINTMWAGMGALGCSPLDGLVSPSYNVYRMREGSELLPTYYDYLCRLPSHRTAMKARSSGVWESRLRLYPDAFLDMRLVVPPMDEQRAIVSRLAVETARWDSLIAEAQRAITLLQERRTALITAAVTGQIDVRGLA
jgi:type I restriction enzyme S subunit